MRYRVERREGQHCLIMNSRAELLEYLKHTPSGIITDIRKIYKNGITDSSWKPTSPMADAEARGNGQQAALSAFRQIQNDIRLLHEPVRKFIRTGFSVLIARFLCRASFLNASKAACISPSRSAGKPGFFFALLMILRSAGTRFYKQGHICYLWPVYQSPACFPAPALSGISHCTIRSAGSWQGRFFHRFCISGYTGPSRKADSDNR